LIVSWCGRFLFFVVPCQFSQGIGECPENQILIPDWTYFHCPGATLVPSTAALANRNEDALPNGNFVLSTGQCVPVHLPSGVFFFIPTAVE